MKNLILILLISLSFSTAALEITLDGKTYTGNRVVITDSAGTKTIQAVDTPKPVQAPQSTCAAQGVQVIKGTLTPGLKFFNFRRNQALSFRFTGKQGQMGMAAIGASTRKGNGYKVKAITVSECPGDFDVTASSCKVLGVEGSVYFKFDSTKAAGFCQLQPGKTYYVNVRNWDERTKQDTCSPNELCGFSINTVRY